ncbi:hypothetical protein L6164_031924 [Bauhinia variegata]|uniref:Uncharacterized protein n=1 Tax=Bauhinia variegata TaxID=167791 RepID=A0ACB9KM54_BAUVA|nr:hypothetical protein L6164_031924 [Bauhinia variegata]
MADNSPSSSPPSPNSESSPPPPSPPDDSSPSSPTPKQSPPSSSPPPPAPKQSPHPPSSPPPPSSSNDGNESPPPPSNDSGGNNNSPPPSPPNSNNDGRGKSGTPPSPPPPKGSNQDSSSPSSSHRLSPSEHNSARNSSKSASTDSPSSDGSSGNALSVNAIVGIAAAVAILITLMIILTYCCMRKKKRPQNIHHYHNHPEYFKNATAHNQQWNANGDHVVNIPPPPGAAQKSWTPSPRNQMPSSDIISDASYSGPHGPALPPPHPSVALGFNKSTFSYEELSAATGGFSSSNLLGQGGFGYVHKGVLPNGKEIAVKSLKSTGGQGDKEFQAEVDVISRVHHRYLVSLVGYCFSDGKKLLVYEYVPNKTLEYHLHGKGRPVMDWGTRIKIAIGSAKGLAYLHEDCHPRIIHRDIKGANILIENNFEAKVADFGLAKFNQDNYTHVSTRVMGTFGYLAPEYASSGKLTEKSDVFSYGIMLLELITGRPPIDTTGEYQEDSLVDWARPLCINGMDTGNFEGLVDPRLENNYDRNEMARMIACASASVRHSARKRPKMSQIVRALEGDVSLDDLSEGGVKPGQSTVFGGASGEYDASAYSADIKKFRKLAFDSSHDSSDCGATSEYGLNPSASSSDRSSEFGKRT